MGMAHSKQSGMSQLNIHHATVVVQDHNDEDDDGNDNAVITITTLVNVLAH
jgi:hypothetical protein